MAVAIMPAVTFASKDDSRLKVVETIVIYAAPAKVWSAIKDFSKAYTWIPAVEATSANGGNKPGATRTLTLKGGPTVSEELKKFDDEKMTYVYKITDVSSVGEINDHGTMHAVPAFPVSNYKSWVRVEAVDGGSKVIWGSRFSNAYQGSHKPPAGLDNKAAKAAVTGLYTSSLRNLKAMLEK